jgi:hypothetical protein
LLATTLRLCYADLCKHGIGPLHHEGRNAAAPAPL